MSSGKADARGEGDVELRQVRIAHPEVSGRSDDVEQGVRQGDASAADRADEHNDDAMHADDTSGRTDARAGLLANAGDMTAADIDAALRDYRAGRKSRRYNSERDFDIMPECWQRRRRTMVTLVVPAFLILFVSLVVVVVVGRAPVVPPEEMLERLLTYDTGIGIHLSVLQQIADQNSGTRVVGLGYNASAEYVEYQLRTAGLRPWREYFSMPWSTTLRPPFLVQRDPVEASLEFATLSFSGSGNVTAPLVIVANRGCDAADVPLTVSGRVALVQRGDCTFYQKATNAAAKGAAAVIVYNSNGGGVFSGTLGEPVVLPVVGVSAAVGESLRAQALESNVHVSVGVFVQYSTVTTFNVLCDVGILGAPPANSSADVIIVGAHLDSVEAGPGINDNGSGASMILSIALRLRELIVGVDSTFTRPSDDVILSFGNSTVPEPDAPIDPVGGRARELFDGLMRAASLDRAKATRHVVRFGWWGAEEEGLRGSAFHVANMPADQRARVVAALNFDMVASPNFERAVLNGSQADGGARNGSMYMQDRLQMCFTSMGLQFGVKTLDGRSDYASFEEAGIPVAGVETGAEKVKTVEQRHMYGGVALVPFDPCYHLACDTIENINKEVLMQVAKCGARLVQHLVYMRNLRDTLTEDEELDDGSDRAGKEAARDAGKDPCAKPFRGKHAVC